MCTLEQWLDVSATEARMAYLRGYAAGYQAAIDKAAQDEAEAFEQHTVMVAHISRINDFPRNHSWDVLQLDPVTATSAELTNAAAFRGHYKKERVRSGPTTLKQATQHG